MPDCYLDVRGGQTSGNYPYGATTQIYADSVTGYTFSYWSDFNCEVQSPTSPVSDVRIYYTPSAWVESHYVINTYTLTYSAGTGGSIVGTTPQSVTHGSNGTLVTATPASGYHFVKWSDNNTTAARTDTNVQASASYTATFAANNPTVTSLSPSTDVPAGGVAVTITGAQFTGATSVKFDTTEVSSFTVVSDTSITTTAPAHAVGSIGVHVTNASGTGTKDSAFTYAYATPSLAGILSFAGGVFKKAVGKNPSGVLSLTGALQYILSHANERYINGVLTFSGKAFGYKSKPVSLTAPHVPTILNPPQ